MQTKMQVTVGDLQENLGVEYATANAVIQLLVSQGLGSKVGQRKTSTGKGKPSTVYELPTTFTLSLEKKAA